MSLPRSMSATSGRYNNSQMPKNSHDFQSEGYLVSSKLWEKVTGEKVSPCDMMTVLFSTPGTIASQKALEIIKMTQDRAGSMDVQCLLDESDAKKRDFIIDSLIPNIAELSLHPCANFVIQKVCEKASPRQINQIGTILYGNFDEILSSPTGCRVIQKFLEVSPPALIVPAYNIIKPSFVQLSLSLYGNHIIHRIIEAVPEKAAEIVEIVTQSLNDLMSNNFGCRIVQNIFGNYSTEVLRPLIDEVIDHAKDLSTSQFGNYIVQTVLDIGTESDQIKIVDNIIDKFVEFSMHKLASNVTEKCIKTVCQAEREKIFDVVMGKGNFNYARISQLATDQYGNYIIQRIIEFGTEEQLNAIYTAAKMDFDRFWSVNFSRHVISKLEERGYKFHQSR